MHPCQASHASAPCAHSKSLKKSASSNLSSFSKLGTLGSNGARATLLQSIASALFPVQWRGCPLITLLTTHHRLPRGALSSLESTLAKVYQNIRLYLPLESTLTKNPGGGSVIVKQTFHEECLWPRDRRHCRRLQMLLCLADQGWSYPRTRRLHPIRSKMVAYP